MAMFFALALVLAQALAIQANVVPIDIEAVCADSSTVELTRTSQIQELAKVARQSNCPNHLKGAILELAQIVSQDSEDLCSMDAADTLRYFYTQYMDSQSIKEDHKSQLPDSLKNFVLAYGLQMSNLCKKEMVRALSEEARGLLDADDFKLVDKVTDEQSPLAAILQTMGGPDEIFLPGDLAPLMKNQGKAAGPEKLFMQTSTTPWIRRIQSTCQRRFKPIYEPLMIPITRLSYMGFNYKDSSLKCSLECPKNIREVGQWARIVLLCESLAAIHLVEDPAGKDLTEGTDAAQVKIISKEEAAAIEGAQAEAAADEHRLPEVHFERTRKVHLGDLVLDKSDGEFVHLIKKFRVGQTEAELVKRNMASKGIAFIKRQMKQGKVGFMVSTAIKALTSKDNSSPGAALVRALDEMVASRQSHGEGAVAFVGGAYMVANNGVSATGTGGATSGYDDTFLQKAWPIFVNTLTVLVYVGFFALIIIWAVSLFG